MCKDYWACKGGLKNKYDMRRTTIKEATDDNRGASILDSQVQHELWLLQAGQ